MPGCCAVGCSNKTEDGFSLHNIPRGIRNSARREVWLQNISREDFRATPSTWLCEEHFTPDQFEPLAFERGVKKLRRDAVPTLFKPSRQRRRTKGLCFQKCPQRIRLTFQVKRKGLA
ncbi:THAP domain-containing protein 5-like isoform X1 [Rhipicephalus microplus]|uniref:THAP domain-containing protein 5-like isoform X1 n=1 Tax=Rhipicephalus microplus TaxID=6941 RepID=UPI003F6AE3EA